MPGRTPVLALAILAAPCGPSTLGEEPGPPAAQEGRQPLPGAFRFRVGKVRTFSGRTRILAGITAIPTPGHTPGRSAYLLESEGDRIEFWVDLTQVAQAQLPRPAITIAFDVDRSAAARQRAAQFDEAARERKLVAAPHLPFPGVGHLRAEGEGYAWVPLPYRDREGK